MFIQPTVQESAQTEFMGEEIGARKIKKYYHAAQMLKQKMENRKQAFSGEE